MKAFDAPLLTVLLYFGVSKTYWLPLQVVFFVVPIDYLLITIVLSQ